MQQMLGTYKVNKSSGSSVASWISRQKWILEWILKVDLGWCRTAAMGQINQCEEGAQEADFMFCVVTGAAGKGLWLWEGEGQRFRLKNVEGLKPQEGSAVTDIGSLGTFVVEIFMLWSCACWERAKKIRVINW